MKPTPLITLFLIFLNVLVWKMGSVFLYNPPRKTLPPNPESKISRTADDIARGLLSMKRSLSEEQYSTLQPLFQKGYLLRKKWENENQQYTEFQEELLQETRRLLVEQ